MLCIDQTHQKELPYPIAEHFLLDIKALLDRSFQQTQRQLEPTNKGQLLEVEEEDNAVGDCLALLKNQQKNPTVRSLAKQGIKHLPGFYNTTTKRIKNDKLRSVLQSDTAQGLVNKFVNEYSARWPVLVIQILKSILKVNLMKI